MSELETQRNNWANVGTKKGGAVGRLKIIDTICRCVTLVFIIILICWLVFDLFHVNLGSRKEGFDVMGIYGKEDYSNTWPRLEGFSLSKKPFEEDNSLLYVNPFDNQDYQTPYFKTNTVVLYDFDATPSFA